MSLRPSFILLGESQEGILATFGSQHALKSDTVALTRLGTIPTTVFKSTHIATSELNKLDQQGPTTLPVAGSKNIHKSQAHLIAKTFDALFVTSLEPTLSAASITFDPSDVSSSSVTDFEDVIWNILDFNEAKFEGVRRVQNLLDDSNFVSSPIHGDYYQTFGGAAPRASAQTSSAWPERYVRWSRLTTTSNDQGKSAKDRHARKGLYVSHHFWLRQGYDPETIIRTFDTYSQYTGRWIDHTTSTEWTHIHHVAKPIASSVDGPVISSTAGTDKENWEIAQPQLEPYMSTSTDKVPSEYVSHSSTNDEHGANYPGVQYFTYKNATVSASAVVFASGSSIGDLTIPGLAMASTTIEIPTANVNTEEGAIIFVVTPKAEDGPLLHWSSAEASSLAVRLSGGILHYDVGGDTIESLAPLAVDTEYVVGIGWGNEAVIYIDGNLQGTVSASSVVDTTASILYVGSDGAGNYSNINIRGIA